MLQLKSPGNGKGSFIGYMYGGILDRFEGLAGYRIVYIIMAVFAAGGFLLSTYILNTIKKERTGEK
ncbi:MAG: hypothetical protein HFG54_00390 [Lachnospiraceae bacterium]|nr:hypothetical protein [Lachnospiraceae bacterium]